MTETHQQQIRGMVRNIANALERERIEFVNSDPIWSAQLAESGMAPLPFIRQHSDDIGVAMHLSYERKRSAQQ